MGLRYIMRKTLAAGLLVCMASGPGFCARSYNARVASGLFEGYLSHGLNVLPPAIQKMALKALNAPDRKFHQRLDELSRGDFKVEGGLDLQAPVTRSVEKAVDAAYDSVYESKDPSDVFLQAMRIEELKSVLGKLLESRPALRDVVSSNLSAAASVVHQQHRAMVKEDAEKIAGRLTGASVDESEEVYVPLDEDPLKNFLWQMIGLKPFR